jgi:two-component system NarL family response regulator
MSSPPVEKVVRILIVDDHAFFRRGIREVINDEEDMEVVGEALDGEQAVQMVKQLRPERLDLVLMDIDMPRMDGITATELITGDDPDLPIVMLTVSTLDRDLFEAVRVGAVGFLSKSLSPEALVRSLRGFHRGESLPMSPSMAQKVLGYFQQSSASSSRVQVVEPSDITLTARENEVLELIATGARDREIADQLVVTESTVKKHVQNILRKLHARNRAEAVARMRDGSL